VEDTGVNAGVHLSTWQVILVIAVVAIIAGAAARRRQTRQARPAESPERPQAAESAPVILVLITGAPASTHALEAACLLARERAAEILLAYIVVVPLTSPLDAPIEEMVAQSALALAAAQETVAGRNLPVRSLVRRARSMASGLLAAAQESQPNLMVIGVGPSQKDAAWGRMVEKVAERAGCEVIVDRLPEGAGRGAARPGSV
jgi:nucleotide-binding universal stress UspA family protein